MPPLRRLLSRLAYEVGPRRALDNARREAEDLDHVNDAIDALALRVARAEVEVPRVA